ncbi:MAG: transposase [Treponema sp.]|nr:transposase [Treponema sp.]
MRKPREYCEEGLYHTYARGINKQNIFFEREDKDFMLKLIYKYAKKYKIKIHTYVLLDNHFHLEMKDPHKNLSKYMGLICSLYARYFNKKYDRIGHLFQDRFGSNVVNSKKKFLECFRYILQNPENAGICKASEYEWSSYHLYKDKDSPIYKDLLFEYLGSIENLYNYVKEKATMEFIDLELRPSEKIEACINKMRKILHRENTLVPPDWSKEKIGKEIRKLRKAGFSINIIARYTGISRGIIQRV